MKNLSRLLIMIVCLCGLTVSGVQAQDFTSWLEQLRIDARSAGISQKTLDAALADIEAPQPRVIERDRKQPEKTQSLEDYVAARVSKERIVEGRTMLRRYATWLGRIESQYRVQRRFIVALWGVESNYGRHTGKRPVIQSLVTLAYDGRRSDYFRKELLEALHILEDGHIPLGTDERFLGRGYGTFPVHALPLIVIMQSMLMATVALTFGILFPMPWLLRPITLPRPGGRMIRLGDGKSNYRKSLIIHWLV